MIKVTLELKYKHKIVLIMCLIFAMNSLVDDDSNHSTAQHNFLIYLPISSVIVEKKKLN